MTKKQPDRPRRPTVPTAPVGRAPLALPAISLDAPPAQACKRVTLRSLGWSPFHFRKRILRAAADLEPGELAALENENGSLLGFGMFNPLAEIAVRVLTAGDQPPGPAWWDERLQSALSLRKNLLRLDAETDAYRVVHAEADGLSGLVVDRFADVLSIEIFSAGMLRRGRAIVERLQAMLGTSHWRIQPGPRLAEQEGVGGEVEASADCPRSVEIREHGTRFRVRFEDGHKTGFFCDQRDNRKRLAAFCEGKRVLDVCTYSGGFAVQARRLGKAEEVTAVDLDEKAIAVAKENANLNQQRISFVHADGFTYMRDMLRLERRYDVVVLDPPKLVESRFDIDEGKRKLFDMNRLAMALVEPGGLLLTCCCAGLVSEEEFLDLVLSAARRTIGDDERQGVQGRRVQILDRTSASPDHPVADNCPETAYLKAIWLRVL